MDLAIFETFGVVILGSLGLGFLFALSWPKSQSVAVIGSLILALIGGSATVGAAIWYWFHPFSVGNTLIELPPVISGMPALSLEFYVDRLGALFLMLTGFFTAAVAVYSLSWLREEKDQRFLAGVFNLFVMFTILTIVINNVYFLIVFIEGMTLSFAYLVLYRHNKYVYELDNNQAEETPQFLADLESAKSAIKTYLIISHIGVMFVTAALIMLGAFAGTFNLDGFRDPNFILPTGVANTVFLLALVGLGIKIGLFPFHVWVSAVHPYSPTNVHAMMSGVVLKVAGIYLIIRIFFEFLGPSEWWWGWVVVLIAGLTAVVGVFYALVSRDLKTALASHTVENIGIILAGIGLALVFSSGQIERDSTLHGLAGLALIASLYHLINHSIFKGLLFLCTGAIENRTGHFEFDKLGGTMKRYPWTSTAFLIGAVSIAGFPPFNGFISEWLTLQALFGGMDIFATNQTLPALLGLLLVLVMLGTAFGLTAFAFVKISGETLLGSPKSTDIVSKSKIGDVPWSMRGILLTLAALCLLLGLFPSVVVSQLANITTDLGIQANYLSNHWGGVSITVPVEKFEGAPEAGYSATLNSLIIVGFASILGLAILLIGVRKLRTKVSVKPVWVGGVPYSAQTMQPMGGSFTSLVWMPFRRRARPTQVEEEVDSVPQHLVSRYAVSESVYVPEYFSKMYNILLERILSTSERIGGWFQKGDIRRYLRYIFGIFVSVLVISIVLALRTP